MAITSDGMFDKSSGQPQDCNHGIGASVECTWIPGSGAEVAARRSLIGHYFFGGKKQIVNAAL